MDNITGNFVSYFEYELLLFLFGQNEISLSEQVATLTSDYKSMEAENKLKQDQLTAANQNMVSLSLTLKKQF